MIARMISLLALVLACVWLQPSRAENPIIQTSFTADPAPLVHKGVVYLYTGQDEDDAREFKMRNWRLYTSTDMSNWTDKGVVASLATFPWALQDNDAWASQVVERDGKFYLYASVSVQGWPKSVIAVAVADRPEGPFKDALGKPLIDKAIGYFDPTVFVDDDGQAYMYWGNPNLYYVKLNRDMISYSGEIQQAEGKNANSTGNHPGIVDYMGASYLFGFNYRLNFADTPIHRERRSVTVTRFDYNADGSINMLPWWDNVGVPPLKPLSPHERVEAETMAWTSRLKRDRDRQFDWAPGIKTARDDKVGVYVTHITDLDYIKVNGVDFGSKGAARFVASLASETDGGKIELRLDSVDGPHLGTLTVARTGRPDQWQQQSAPVSGATGVHDLYLIFRGRGEPTIFEFDHWRFERE